jgi:hypothetical protein
MTVTVGYDTTPKCWNEHGFQVACGVTSAPNAAITTTAAINHQPSQVVGDIAATTTTNPSQRNSAPGTDLAMRVWCALGFVAIAALL